nr:unnamed protein product [Callosobruchus analis]
MVITREIREEIMKSVSNSIHSILKDDEFLNSLVKKVSDNVIKTLEARITTLEQKVKDNSAVILELKDEANMLKYENEALSQKYDQLDQFTRSNNIRIFRLKEKPQEDVTTEVINLLTSHLGVTINADDIYSCMRVGKKLNNTPRGILVKFLKPNIKRNIYKNKKMLKGSGVVIKEDLTENRLKLMDAAIERTTLRSVWSSDGTIYASKGGKVIVIKNKSDLGKL